MTRFHSLFVLLLLLLSSHTVLSQGTHDTAQLLHQNGQIYLVVLVVLTIFVGIIWMLWRLEKKINKLEKGDS
jgi:hypothetical protein